MGNTLLPEKETMKLLYDYGDCWRFSVRLERIDPPDKTARHSQLIASAGEAPEQYPGPDEEA